MQLDEDGWIAGCFRKDQWEILWDLLSFENVPHNATNTKLPSEARVNTLQQCHVESEVVQPVSSLQSTSEESLPCDILKLKKSKRGTSIDKAVPGRAFRLFIVLLSLQFL